MVIPQYAGDLVRPFSLGAELKDTLDDTLCLPIGNKVLAVPIPLAVTVRWLSA